MTPKERAEELIYKFDYPNIKTGLMSSERKQCAIICVNEMLYQYEYISAYLSPDWCNKQIEYLEKVKSILETFY